MANKVKEKSPEEKLVEEIQKLGRTHGMNTVFTNFLELTALVLAIQMDPVNRAERQENYEKLEKSMDREALSAYGRMTFYLILAIREYHSDPKDILGEVYTRLKLSNEWNGQFFTPDSISRFMAEILQIPEDIPKEKGYVTINEPTCGSGEICILRKGKAVFFGTVEQAKKASKCEKFEDAYLMLSGEEGEKE